MAYLAFVSSSLLATVTYVLLKDTDSFNPLRRFVKENIKNTEAVFARLVTEYIPKDYLRLNQYLNIVLIRSGINRMLPWFKSRHLVLFMVLTFIGTSWFLRALGLMSLVYGMAGVFLLFSILLLMSALNKQAVRKMYLNFINVYSGFYDLEQNEINALARSAEYMQEPLKTILIKWTTRYKASNISIEDCLEGILTEIGDKEFRKFIKFTKVNAKYGGDYKKALDKLREQGEKLQSVYAMKASSAVVGTFVIILMIAISLILVFGAIKDPFLLNNLRNTGQGQLILLGNAAGIIIAILMIFNINKD